MKVIRVDIDPEWEEDMRAENEHECLKWLFSKDDENIITLPPDQYWEENEYHSEL